MKKDDFIKSILESSNSIKKVEPNIALWNKIETKIYEAENTISNINFWQIAASIVLLISVNAYFLFNQNSIDNKNTAQQLVKITNNQLYSYE